MVNRILTITSVVLFIGTLVFAFLWRLDHNKYNHACELLTDAEIKIDILKQENANLLEYNLKREQELKEIEANYKERLNNIPTDKCGDIKPSKELLMYLRKQK